VNPKQQSIRSDVSFRSKKIDQNTIHYNIYLSIHLPFIYLCQVCLMVIVRMANKSWTSVSFLIFMHAYYYCKHSSRHSSCMVSTISWWTRPQYVSKVNRRGLTRFAAPSRRIEKTPNYTQNKFEVKYREYCTVLDYRVPAGRGGSTYRLVSRRTIFHEPILNACTIP
jgi:subtilase family serine protease